MTPPSQPNLLVLYLGPGKSCAYGLVIIVCCSAVNIDEVYALEQLYKDVSNSLHQVIMHCCSL